ncbi:MAG: response regulator [Euryarchaeota archaeon]|nr:response regulator [Euryarchaeota archaeon]
MKNLLVVEDSEMFYRLIKSALKNVNVLWAKSGEEAIEKYKSFRPNLVLVDIILPDMNGVEVIHQLKKYDENAKIIVVSGIDHNEVMKESLAAGAVDYIPKTAGIEHLRRKINENI